MSFRLWADLMKAKSEVVEWQEEVKLVQSFKNRTGFESLSQEAQGQINTRINYATTNLAQHQLAFEAIVSQSIALDRSVSKTNAALARTPAMTTTPREIEWMREYVQLATARMDELERKLVLRDQQLERVNAEHAAGVALSQLPPAADAQSPMEIDDGDGILDGMPSLKRRRTDDEDHGSSLRRRTLARTIADLREANEALTDRIAEAEGTIEGILNDAVEDLDGVEISREARLKEIVQDYQTCIENAKAASEVAENNSRVVETLKTEAENAIAAWNEVYPEFEAERNEGMEMNDGEKEVR